MITSDKNKYFFYKAFFWLLKIGSYSNQRGPFDVKNPFMSSILIARELHTGGDRSCMHFEVDITGSRIRYESGDHLGIYATNAPELVDKLGELYRVYKLSRMNVQIENKDGAQSVNGIGNGNVNGNATVKVNENGNVNGSGSGDGSGSGNGNVNGLKHEQEMEDLETPFALENMEELASRRHPFPCPCSFRTAFTYYLDISGPPRASLLGDLASFAPNPDEIARLKLMATATPEGFLTIFKFLLS